MTQVRCVHLGDQNLKRVIPDHLERMHQSRILMQRENAKELADPSHVKGLRIGASYQPHRNQAPLLPQQLPQGGVGADSSDLYADV